MEPGFAFAKIDPGTDERFVSLRRALGVSTFGINQIRLAPGQRGRIHRHLHQEEVYLVISGTLTLWIEGERHELGPGEVARVAPEVRRQIANPHRDEVLLIALGGANEHVGRDGHAYTGWDDATGASPQEIPLPDDEPV
jgi:mannose-6-phosphate isomerase-like protein (cupin superfamily)